MAERPKHHGLSERYGNHWHWAARAMREGVGGTQLREEALQQGVMAEMRAEQAAALGRAGRRLGLLCERAAQIRYTLENSKPCAGLKRDLLDTYQCVRKEARLRRWEMIVQRESMGLCAHEEVDAAYPLPPRIEFPDPKPIPINEAQEGL